MTPLSMAEAKKISDEHNGREDIEPYFKKFIVLKINDARKLKEELESIGNHKIRGEHIAKIIDFLPIDSSDINKIFTDISLEENEIKQITDVVKKYK